MPRLGERLRLWFCAGQCPEQQTRNRDRTPFIVRTLARMPSGSLLSALGNREIIKEVFDDNACADFDPDLDFDEPLAAPDQRARLTQLDGHGSLAQLPASEDTATDKPGRVLSYMGGGSRTFSV